MDAPIPLPPAVSLVRSAFLPQPRAGQTADDFAREWALGIRYLPEADVQVSVDQYCAPAAGTYTYTAPGEVEWLPVTVNAFDRCTALSSFARDYVGRATRLIDSATPKAVEGEFWSGTVAQAQTYPNGYLQKAATVTVLGAVTASYQSVGKAFQLLEQALADCGFGGQGVIHCTRGALPALVASEPALRRDGNLLRTMYDTLVVPGVGYPGTGPIAHAKQTPDAGTAWMYATGLVEYRQTAPTLFPDWPDGESGQIPAGAVNRAVNTVQLWATRTALATWDQQCHFAVIANLPT